MSHFASTFLLDGAPDVAEVISTGGRLHVDTTREVTLALESWEFRGVFRGIAAQFRSYGPVEETVGGPVEI